MNDLEHIAIERLLAASEMSLQAYGLPLVITDGWRMMSYLGKLTGTNLWRRWKMILEITHSTDVDRWLQKHHYLTCNNRRAR